MTTFVVYLGNGSVLEIQAEDFYFQADGTVSLQTSSRTVAMFNVEKILGIVEKDKAPKGIMSA